MACSARQLVASTDGCQRKPDGPPAAWVVVLQVPCPPEQVRQTCLVQRLGEAAIRRPPVAHQHPREVGPEDRCRIVEAATGTNRVDRRRRCGESPQPVADGADAPAGLVRGDHGTVPHLPAQRPAGRRGLTSRAVQHADEAPRRDGDSELGPQQVRDLLQRHAQLRVHPHDQRDGRRTELHAGGSQRIGGLQSVAALDTAPALRAVADLDVEASHEGAHHREVFLVLRRHAGHHHGAATVRTRRRRGGSVGLVDSRRSRATRLPAVLCARAPTRTPTATLAPVLGEGSCLSEPRPTRLVELFLEAFASPLPPVPVALDPRQLLAQPFDLSFLFPNAGIARILLGRRTLRWHHAVMPHPRKLYKYKFLDLARSGSYPGKRIPGRLRGGLHRRLQ